MNSALKEAFERNIARGVALAHDPERIDALLAESKNHSHMIFDCPPIPRIVEGLKSGFTPEEEKAARRQPDFQRMVRIYWRLRPVSFWMLARFLAEGDAFPFAAAMNQHLQEEESGIGSRLALQAAFTRRLATAIQKLSGAKEAWLRLRDRIRLWEDASYRFVTEFPRTTLAFADKESEPYDDGEVFEDGLTVRLEEIRSSKLRIAASRPSGERGPETLAITLVGKDGDALPVSVSLTSTGESSGGRSEVGSFPEVSKLLGPKCLVIISSNPLPDLE